MSLFRRLTGLRLSASSQPTSESGEGGEGQNKQVQISLEKTVSKIDIDKSKRDKEVNELTSNPLFAEIKAKGKETREEIAKFVPSAESVPDVAKAGGMLLTEEELKSRIAAGAKEVEETNFFQKLQKRTAELRAAKAAGEKMTSSQPTTLAGNTTEETHPSITREMSRLPYNRRLFDRVLCFNKSMALTDKDLKNIEKLLDRRLEVKLEAKISPLEKHAERTDKYFEGLEKYISRLPMREEFNALAEKIDLLPTRDEFLTTTDQIIGKYKVISEDHLVLNNQVAGQEKRLSKVERSLGFAV